MLARLFSLVRCCSSSAAAKALVMLSVVLPKMHCPVHCTHRGPECIVYHILCWLFLNLFEVDRRSFSHCSVKVVYRSVRSSARIDRSTGNSIWYLFLVTFKISMSTGVAWLLSLCALDNTCTVYVHVYSCLCESVGSLQLRHTGNWRSGLKMTADSQSNIKHLQNGSWAMHTQTLHRWDIWAMQNPKVSHTHTQDTQHGHLVANMN